MSTWRDGWRRTAGAMVIIAALGSAAACGSSGDGSADDSSGPSSGSTSAGTTTGSHALTLETQQAAVSCPILAHYVSAGSDQTEKYAESMADTYSVFKIEAICPGTVSYEYTYKHHVDPEAAKRAFAGQEATLRSGCDTKVFPDMIRGGITTQPRVEYTYFNSDGSQLFTYTCVPS